MRFGRQKEIFHESDSYIQSVPTEIMFSDNEK